MTYPNERVYKISRPEILNRKRTCLLYKEGHEERVINTRSKEIPPNLKRVFKLAPSSQTTKETRGEEKSRSTRVGYKDCFCSWLIVSRTASSPLLIFIQSLHPVHGNIYTTFFSCCLSCCFSCFATTQKHGRTWVNWHKVFVNCICTISLIFQKNCPLESLYPLWIVIAKSILRS